MKNAIIMYGALADVTEINKNLGGRPTEKERLKSGKMIAIYRNEEKAMEAMNTCINNLRNGNGCEELWFAHDRTWLEYKKANAKIIEPKTR